ncbi:MAG: glutamine-hydrolyzing carbamoyl-phosphate synthase small subunit [Oscillospiraceae bacterium]|nr:glutamine-hydrolyzing carbamoyl-phosphate synthase small subunit [Oscillospiraceae bacterium]
MKQFDKKLVLETGDIYYGYGFGYTGEDRLIEAVFNTSMAGYQEIFSDPSYTDQGVVFTYPLIGNYGMPEEDYETDFPSIGALIVREYNPEPSNFRGEKSLGEIMEQLKVPGIWGIDTRKLAKSIREKGCCKAYLCSAELSDNEAMAFLSANQLPHDAVSRVSCKKAFRSDAPSGRYLVAAIDCGMKKNIVRSLNRHGCDVVVLPYNTSAEEVLKLSPDGVFISNGPGDPKDASEVIELIKALRGKLPVFGICLGHQIIALACGGDTYKLKFGHRGGNHPVRNLKTGKIEMTSQNHSYAVNPESLEGTGLTVTHINILDNTVEGQENKAEKIFSVQYHPESAPGPQDSDYLFDYFISMLEENSHA